MLLSARKRYLSGSDWVINTLDRMMKSVTCAGNMSQIVLVLDGPVDENEVRSRLNTFIRRFPVVRGTVARDIKLAPYWKIPRKASEDVALFSVDLGSSDSQETLLEHLAESANRKFRGESEHLVFHLMSDKGKSVLAMTFDHRLFDARGAEMFLDLFQQGSDGGGASGDIIFGSSHELTQWKKKFLAGRNVNRRIMTLSKTSDPASLPFPTGNDRGYVYRLLTLDQSRTSAIYEAAYKEAGYLLESPYILAMIVGAVHEVLQDRLTNGSDYLIPVTTDLRPGRDPLLETFFNHVTYLFYRVPRGTANRRKEVIELLKQQMYDQVKAGFPKDLAEASLLTRIAPLPLLGKLLHLPLKGKMATFAFSHLGKSSYRSTEFMGRKVLNLFHMPRVPVPPGFGFFSTVYNGQLNIVISSLDGLLADKDIDLLMKSIQENLGAD
jgi:hypothetical protein